ncbi:pyridoxal phosphate-dependent decarboxylase family protein [Angustibacter luteus]|uniref:Pyridoxal phosphate-dependent decarboxylase family protein n=1 Tax=Angustibacter luteus TaxID=658456 RepID=A0ABW1JBH9_9ACTN
MHSFDADVEALSQAVLDYTLRRSRMNPVPLDGPRTQAELDEVAGQTITADGLGGVAALELFTRELAPACISTDHPRYLSFIPCAPTEASTLFDLVVGASSIYGGSWLEGAGAVHAENAALRWISDLAGLPESAGGVFVPGGTIGNLSALVAARHAARREGGEQPTRWKVAGTTQAHSSIKSACDIMDVDFLGVPVDDAGRLTGENLRATLASTGTDGLFAVVATAGTTNFGIVDDLASVAAVCAELGVWFHVDGAYGGAGLAAPSIRARYDGIEQADSFIVDPHKWLFAPFDCCALIYRDPQLGRAAHTQKAGYLDVLTESAEFNPSDYSVGLTRRARGLPFWFSLATHGTDAYAAAVERTLEVTRFAAAQVEQRDYLELLREPDTSVVVFRRVGWTPQQYQRWSDRLLLANFAFVVPTTHEGETVTRFAIVNPNTSEADISTILDTMA